MTKLLHTADWHLGRIFHQIHLTEDQGFALEGLISIIEQERPDVVIVAGDVYDRAVPPPEAVELLDRTLSRIAFDLKVPLVLIPGNHDSATRLGFGAKLLRDQGVHIIASLEAASQPVLICGTNGVQVQIFGLPYAEPPLVRQLLGEEHIRDHQSAMEAMCNRLRQHFQPNARHVLVGHAFVVGGAESDSERPLSVGGAGTVSAAAFAGFEYVALGHLHAPQQIGGNVAYSGSLLKYSFSECADEKSVVILEFSEHGEPTQRRIAISMRRDVRRIEGRLKELIERAPADSHREDYLHVTLTDDGAILNAMPRLREAYPNALHLERRFLEPRNMDQQNVSARRVLSEVDLFRDFCREVLADDVGDGEVNIFDAAVKEIDANEDSV